MGLNAPKIFDEVAPTHEHNPFARSPDISTFLTDAKKRDVFWRRLTGRNDPLSLSESLATYEQFKHHPGFLYDEELGPMMGVLVQNVGTAKAFIGDAETFEEAPQFPALLNLAEAVVEQSDAKADEEVLERETCSFRLFPGAMEHIPTLFILHPWEFMLGEQAIGATEEPPRDTIIKHEPENEEIIWSVQGETEMFVLKKVQEVKKNMPSRDFELRMLQRANVLGLPAPVPLGLMTHDDGSSYAMMSYESGESGVDLYEKLVARGDEPEDVERKMKVVIEKMTALAERFRAVMFVDKKWYVKDCLIRFDDQGEVEDVFPLDWEHAHPYDPKHPEKIETLETILKRHGHGEVPLAAPGEPRKAA